MVLVYNPKPGESQGEVIPEEVIEGIFDEMNKKFGAYTPLAGTGDRGGRWEQQSEPSMRIEIAVPAERVEEVHQFVFAIGKRLGQKTMYFKAGPPCVEIIKIEEDDVENGQAEGKK